MKRTVIYTRVSSHKQVDNYSLPHQKDTCERYCHREGIEVDSLFEERGESAKTADRTQLNKLLLYCRRNRKRLDYVVVFKVNRFTRKAHDHTTLQALLAKYGIVLRSATEQIDETPAGRFMGTVLAAQGELENDIKSEVTRQNMLNALRAGRWPHQGPLGYVNVPKGTGRASLDWDPQCAEHIQGMFEMYATGKWSKTDVLRHATAKGLRTRKGNRLGAQQVTKMLKNRLYEGWIESKAWEISNEGDFRALVSKAVFARVQRVLARRGNVKATRSMNDPALPLRRFVRCSWCGTPITGSKAKGRSKKYPYYWCKQKACKGDGERKLFVKKDKIEDRFVGLLDSLTPAPGLVDLLVEILKDVWKSRHAETAKRRSDLEAKQTSLTTKRERLVAAFVYKEAIDQDTYNAELSRLHAEESDVLAAMGELGESEPARKDLIALAREVLLDPTKPWVEGDPEMRLVYQRFIFPEGLTYDGESFGTAVTSPVFGWLRSLEQGNEKVVTRRGFEPLLPG